MSIPWATNLLHFHPNKLFKKWFLIWHFVWQMFWLLFKKLGDFFPNHLVTLASWLLRGGKAVGVQGSFITMAFIVRIFLAC
jgi:hypothetical protein